MHRSQRSNGDNYQKSWHNKILPLKYQINNSVEQCRTLSTTEKNCCWSQQTSNTSIRTLLLVTANQHLYNESVEKYVSILVHKKPQNSVSGIVYSKHSIIIIICWSQQHCQVMRSKALSNESIELGYSLITASQQIYISSKRCAEPMNRGTAISQMQIG